MAYLALLAMLWGAEPLGPGDHVRRLTVDGRKRDYIVHIPALAAAKPVPVVLVLHGAGTDAAMTMVLTGMNKKSDAAGFVAVYPNGTGVSPFLTWNAGGWKGAKKPDRPDDVKFISQVLDDLGGVLNVDSKRVFATGLSNGGMMSYRLAAELSDRIAAIAPIAGTMAIDEAKPRRPVSVMHFHGLSDWIVPFAGPDMRTPQILTFKSVEKSIEIWRELNGCPRDATVINLPDRVADGTTVEQKTYSPGKDGTEVILFTIRGGGHTWPGENPPVSLIGNATFDISANDLMWDFFQKHPLPHE